MNKLIDFLKINWRPVIAGLVAVIVLAILVSVGGNEPSQFPTLKVAQKNGETLFSANGAIWEFADVGTQIPSNGALRTGQGAKAMLQTPEATFIRLGENTELKATSITDSLILLTQNSGRSFHRVKLADGPNYQVSALGNTIQVSDAVFDLSVNPIEKRINVKVLEGEVTVELAYSVTADTKTVGKGQEITVDSKGETLFNIADINTDYVSSDWFAWNKEEDRKLGYELRFAAVPTSTKPTETASKSAPAKSTVTTSKPTPGPTYTAGSCKPSLSAKRGLTGLGIQLSWTTCKNDDFQFYKVVRSTTNPSLSYPSTPALVTSSNRTYGSYWDKNLAIGQTYYYRVCVVERLNQVGCGNVAKMAN